MQPLPSCSDETPLPNTTVERLLFIPPEDTAFQQAALTTSKCMMTAKPLIALGGTATLRLPKGAGQTHLKQPVGGGKSCERLRADRGPTPHLLWPSNSDNCCSLPHCRQNRISCELPGHWMVSACTQKAQDNTGTRVCVCVQHATSYGVCHHLSHTNTRHIQSDQPH